MQYACLRDFVQVKIGLGKSFYISGYANPKLRSVPACNVKPTLVTLERNDPAKPYRTGMYYNDKNLQYLVAKSSKGKIISAVEYVWVFDTEEEARSWYNQEVQKIAAVYQTKINKVLENLIDDNQNC
jgi:hypothetical protein